MILEIFGGRVKYFTVPKTLTPRQQIVFVECAQRVVDAHDNSDFGDKPILVEFKLDGINESGDQKILDELVLLCLLAGYEPISSARAAKRNKSFIKFK